ncbi:hypothetical protein CDD81_1751 [Ophiocordyceps australis]|uniref:Cytochrome P450 n=1 Tax=Ophiocordyceps australis TaxID=1399860 RepID=A0A2C5Y852_9HYPO|nr:hypothetical protein CDD81_1751 [Ophiocordyceps australis]
MSIFEYLRYQGPSLWIFLLYLWVIWALQRVYEQRWKLKQRKNVTMATSSSWWGKLFPNAAYILTGPSLLQQNYKTDIPLGIQSQDGCYINFSSASHIKEILEAPEETFVFDLWTQIMFLPQHTMNGVELPNKLGGLHSRVLRALLSNFMPTFSAPMSRIISETFEREFSASTHHDDEGWTHVRCFSASSKVATKTSALIFFGPELAANDEFVEALEKYPQGVVMAGEILKLFPSIIQPLLAPILRRFQSGRKTTLYHVTRLIDQRIRKKNTNTVDKSKIAEPQDCVQIFINAYKSNSKEDWTGTKIWPELLGSFMASSVQPSITVTNIFENLCKYNEWVTLLREELEHILPRHSAPEGKDASFSAAEAAAIDNAPLLDAFIKESSRVAPTDTVTTRRVALKDFTFRDGTMAFNPWRFIAQDENIVKGATYKQGLRNAGRFTDIDYKYPLWGLGRRVCAGRYYAAVFLKLFTAHVLMNYNIKQSDLKSFRKYEYRTFSVPKSDSVISFQRRERRSIS